MTDIIEVIQSTAVPVVEVTQGAVGPPGPPGADGTGLPAGGSNGQLLSRSGTTGVWVDPPSSLPAGGATGNVLAKNSSTNGDAGWVVPPSAPVASVAGRTGAITLTHTDVPDLGTAATKNVGTTGADVAAGDKGLPAGGSNAQVVFNFAGVPSWVTLTSDNIADGSANHLYTTAMRTKVNALGAAGEPPNGSVTVARAATDLTDLISNANTDANAYTDSAIAAISSTSANAYTDTQVSGLAAKILGVMYRWTVTGDIAAAFPTEYVMSNPASEGNVGTPTWTKSVTSNRLRFTSFATGGTQGANTRIWSVGGAQMTASEVTCLWRGRDGNGQSGTGRGQFGIVHRAGINGATSRPWGYIAWHDFAFGSDEIINIGTWQRDATSSAAMAITSTNSTALDVVASRSPQMWRKEVTQVSLTSNVVTVWIDNADRYWAAGDSIDVTSTGQSTIAGTGITISTVTDTQITYAKTASNIAAVMSDVQIKNRGRIFPYWIKSRCTGTGAATTITAKVWPQYGGEPPWTDTNAVWSWTDSTSAGPTTGTGLCGIDVGHLGFNGHWVEIGEYRARSLDGL